MATTRCLKAGLLLAGEIAGPQVLRALGEGLAVCPAGGMSVGLGGEWAGEPDGPEQSSFFCVCSLGWCVCVSLWVGEVCVWRP